MRHLKIKNAVDECELDNIIFDINIESQKMGACLQCCKCSAFFGIFFYVIMGIIILTQSQFLKFDMQSSQDSGITCFIVAGIQLVIFLGLMIYQRKQAHQSISRENYMNLESERSQRPRQSTFKGIAMGDLKVMREDRQRANQQVVL